MALDRQSIEKKDFPVGRRGYDPEPLIGAMWPLEKSSDVSSFLALTVSLG